MLRVLLNPISLVSGLLVLGILYRLRQRRFRETTALTFLWASLTLPALPLLSKCALLPLERIAPSQKLEEYPPADAIVVLGGTTAPLSRLRKVPGETFGNRVLRAAQLYHLKKAPRILVTGGKPYLPVGETPEGAARTEAIDMRDILVSLGVPASAILMEGEAKNTRENGSLSAKVAEREGIHSILLVSSAFQLKRAQRIFVPYFPKLVLVPSEHLVQDERFSLPDLIPSVPATLMSMIALHEWVAWWLGY